MARNCRRIRSAEPSMFWVFAIIMTVIACAALYYAAAGRPVNASRAQSEDNHRSVFRRRLEGIEADERTGLMGAAEALAAKAELARELQRHEAEQVGRPAVKTLGRPVVLVSIGAAAGLALGTYWALGSPTLPSQPLASRPEVLAQSIDLDAAIATIEARLAADPNDLRGWSVIAPAYMDLGRYSDAARAFRRILELAPPTADAETDLAEALMMQSGGVAEGEAVALLESAASRDPAHIRSRFYLASEATRIADYPVAVQRWTELIGMAEGSEPWLATAQEGLAFAQDGGASQPVVQGPNEADILAMVQGLQARLDASGGTPEEWARLLRSYVVLGDLPAAQRAYDAARAAYPDEGARGEIDALAREAGLQ